MLLTACKLPMIRRMSESAYLENYDDPERVIRYSKFSLKFYLILTILSQPSSSSSVGGEMLEQFAQRCDKCPICGNIQGQTGRASEQPYLIEDVPAHCREFGLDDF